MATEAMRSLPIGVPKVMATTVACGRKKFEDVVGEKDLVVIPSICDFTGLNMVTERIIANALSLIHICQRRIQDRLYCEEFHESVYGWLH